MNLWSQVKSQLDAYAAQPTAQPPTLQAADGGVTLTIRLESLQALVCELTSVEVNGPRCVTADAARLATIGQQLADQVRYLLEPLQVHEIDRQRDSVQVRSFPPRKEQRTVRYFEATLTRGGGILLSRFEKPPGQPRRTIAAHVTIEALQLLCEDLARLVA